MLTQELKDRIAVAVGNQDMADELIAAIEAGSNDQGVAVANLATADGSDAATTQALANATKAKLNALLTSLRDAGIIAT